MGWKTLAADKRAVQGGGIARRCTKIHKHGDALLAITGEYDVGMELVEWWRSGAAPASFPDRAKENVSTLIVIQHGAIKSYNTGAYPLVIEADKCAFGSGRDYAEAAMYLGCDAEKAVKVASVFQSDCGDGVDCLTID